MSYLNFIKSAFYKNEYHQNGFHFQQKKTNHISHVGSINANQCPKMIDIVKQSNVEKEKLQKIVYQHD